MSCVMGISLIHYVPAEGPMALHPCTKAWSYSSLTVYQRGGGRRGER